MKNILVPIGSSENASSTLQYAIDFAKNMNSNVFVFRAYNVFTKAGTIINIDEIMLRETNLYLRAIVKNVDTKHVDVKIIAAKGKVIDTINSINNELGIDLIILGPKSNSINEEVFLGSTSGSIVKHTEIPTLVVPEGLKFKPFSNSLVAFKSGILNKEEVLNPLKDIIQEFNPKVNLLLVKTPAHTKEDLVLNSELEAIKTSLTITENATTFHGVLENAPQIKPDILCVFRRNRGFFKKLWEKNSILKKEFNCKVPLLVLSGKQ